MKNKRARRSHCGVYDCSACDLYIAEKCPGCASGNLRLMREGGIQCSVYDCVHKLGIAGCYECTETTCHLRKWPPAQCPLRARFGNPDMCDGFERKLDVTRGAAAAPNRLSEQKTQRLRNYLYLLGDYQARRTSTVSSHQLARGTGVRASLVRRDLSELGALGTPGRGYNATHLSLAIKAALTLGKRQPTIWLGNARSTDWLTTKRILKSLDCVLVGIFDDDCRGRAADGMVVQPTAKAKTVARRRRATLAVVAAERAISPTLIDDLIDAGVRGVLNLTAARLEASASLVIEQADLGSQMLRLLSRLTDRGHNDGGGDNRNAKHGSRTGPKGRKKAPTRARRRR